MLTGQATKGLIPCLVRLGPTTFQMWPWKSRKVRSIGTEKPAESLSPIFTTSFSQKVRSEQPGTQNHRLRFYMLPLASFVICRTSFSLCALLLSSKNNCWKQFLAVSSCDLGECNIYCPFTFLKEGATYFSDVGCLRARQAGAAAQQTQATWTPLWGIPSPHMLPPAVAGSHASGPSSMSPEQVTWQRREKGDVTHHAQIERVFLFQDQASKMFFKHTSLLKVQTGLP